MALIKEFFELTKKYEQEYGSNTVFLMQVGSFFECYGLKDANDLIYGSNINEFSRICDLNIAEKRVCVGQEQVVMAGFTCHFLDKYIKKMQNAGYTVAVYAQDEQCANTTRSLLGVFSPGTYFSSDTENITNITCCIWIEVKADPILLLKTKSPSSSNKQLKVYIGVSTIDIYTGKTSIMEYSEPYIKNPTTFDELEQFISIYNPSETIIISNIEQKDLNDIVSYTNIRSKSIHYVNLLADTETNKNTFRALNCEKQTYQTQLISRFYKFNDINAFFSIFNDQSWSTQSFCYLLDFIYQHNPNLVYKIAEPIIEDKSKRLILANHSLKQLNIIDDSDREYKGKFSSVSKMLNECITPMGKRKFAYHFLNPITDKIYLQKEYDITEHLLVSNFEQSYSAIKNLLVPIKDLVKINRQIILEKISPKTIYQLYTGIQSTKLIYNFVTEKPIIYEYLKQRIAEFDNLLVYIIEIVEKLDTFFIMEDCKDIENIQKIERSFIRKGTDQTLDDKIRILTESQDQLECCRAYFSSIISNYETGSKKPSKKSIKHVEAEEGSSSEYVKIHETEKNNYSLFATDRRCKILEEVLKKGNVHTVSLKYNSRFYNEEREFKLDLENDKLEYNKQTTTNKTIENNQINKLCKDVSLIKANFIETVVEIYNKIIKSLDVYQSQINTICELITYTDLIFSKAFIANKYNYCKPTIDTSSSSNDKSFIKATDLRHCLIEKIQQSELYVANDISIGLNQTDGILLYGTNAVGKTSFIRALGISVIMAQAGIYVPASSYNFNPYKYIFTRILGNDNLFKGLSTFAVEMSELRIILRLADKNSLVLGDELCSGTESTSATSIFVAGIQSLHQKQCSFIFATHLHEIINYDEIRYLDSVALKHMSVIYDKERDCLIYDRKLKDGPGTNMYGLEVCKSLSLPQDFLEAALNIRMKYHPETASILDQKKSHYNARFIKGLCEKCYERPAIDVHHLIHQQDADEKGMIQKKDLTLHKNHAANLLNLCQKCHDDFHSEENQNKRYKKVKTTKGTVIKEI
jgi:DNA mismatch repair protein MutS